MKKLLGKLVLVCALIASLFAGGTQATADLIYTFDENGNGTYNDGTVSSLPGILLADPSNGGALALTYLIPQGRLFGHGDIFIHDQNGAVSDLIRFTDQSGDITNPGGPDDRIIFYSIDAGSLADTGLPANSGQGNIFFRGTTFSENPDGTFFIQGIGAEYFGTSGNSVPEPSTLALLALSGLGLAGSTYRRRRAATV